MLSETGNQLKIDMAPPKNGPFTGEDLSGKKFERLTVIRFHHFYIRACKRGGGRWSVQQRFPVWECQCKCGKITTVFTSALKSGNTKSCGCLSVEKRPYCNRIHGESRTFLYRIWAGMKTRCINPNRDFWKDYGGRGIRVCARWDSFENFKSDMAGSYFDGALLERMDTNGNYEPGNCKWATALEQANNTRVNRVVSFNGKTQTVANWARELKMNPYTLYNRLNKWSVERALTEPVHNTGIKYVYPP